MSGQELHTQKGEKLQLSCVQKLFMQLHGDTKTIPNEEKEGEKNHLYYIHQCIKESPPHKRERRKPNEDQLHVIQWLYSITSTTKAFLKAGTKLMPAKSPLQKFGNSRILIVGLVPCRTTYQVAGPCLTVVIDFPFSRRTKELPRSFSSSASNSDILCKDICSTHARRLHSSSSNPVI